MPVTFLPSIGRSTWACRITRRIFASWSSAAHRTSAANAPDEAQRGIAQFPSLRVRRSAARGPPMERAASHLAGNAAAAALGRPGDRRVALRALSRSAASDGVEIMEPLSFKGRRGSGLAGDRAAAMLTRPEAALGLAEVRQYWQSRLGPVAVQSELRSRRLATLSARAIRRRSVRGRNPLWPTPAGFCPLSPRSIGHRPANNTYWPRSTSTIRLSDPTSRQPYRDTPFPECSECHSFDPQLFSRINDFADQLLKGERSGKYSPIEAADWIEMAAAAAKELAQAESRLRAYAPGVP